MKRVFCLSLVVLSTAILAHAQMCNVTRTLKYTPRDAKGRIVSARSTIFTSEDVNLPSGPQFTNKWSTEGEAGKEVFEDHAFCHFSAGPRALRLTSQGKTMELVFIFPASMGNVMTYEVDSIRFTAGKFQIELAAQGTSSRDKGSVVTVPAKLWKKIE